MIILLRMLMVILMLGPITAPAAIAMPLEPATTELATPDAVAVEAMAENGHACCPSEAESNAQQLVAELVPSHMDCDNSCSDCQHFCHASGAGLLTASRLATVHTTSERSSLGAAAPYYSTTPLERPPHHA